MAIPYTEYLKIKNNYCISYLGFNEDFIVILKNVLPYLKEKFPQINITIATREEYAKQYGFSTMKEINPKTMGYFEEIKSDMVNHPIEVFFQNAQIEIPKFEFKEYKNQNIKRCNILTNAVAPNKKINSDKISHKYRNLGYEITINGNIQQSGLVIGVECADLYKAAFYGINTILVPSGIGEKLFKKLFPKNQILIGEEYII